MFSIGTHLLAHNCRSTIRQSTRHISVSFSFSSSLCFFSSRKLSTNQSNIDLNLKPFNPEELETIESVNTRLRRSLLYVPGNDQRKIDKVKSILNSVDSVVLDCEDGVAVNQKVLFLFVCLLLFYSFI